MRLLLVATLVAVQAAVHGQDEFKPKLIWRDNFDKWDPTKWDMEASNSAGGRGFQALLPDHKNVFVKNGKLHIKATKLAENINPKTKQPFGEEFLKNGVLNMWDLYGKCSDNKNWGCFRDQGNVPPIASGGVITKRKFNFRYGRLVMRAKLSGGDWMWPVISLLPEDSVYGPWPASGEVKLVEMRGNRDLRYSNRRRAGQQEITTSCHWGVSPSEDRWSKSIGKRYNQTHSFAQKYHTFVLEWNENGMRFYVDGTQYLDVPNPLINFNPRWTGFYDYGKPWKSSSENPWAGASKMAPFDQKFFIMIRMQVGGIDGFFADNMINHGGRFRKPWSDRTSWRQAKDSFYAKRGDWEWTWVQNDQMEIDYVHVYDK